MPYCAKCSLTFPEAAKICRSCGSILDDVDEQSTPAVRNNERQHSAIASSNNLPSADGELQLSSTPAEASWHCHLCGEEVPATFEMCWNCGAAPDGSSGEGFVTESLAIEEAPAHEPLPPEPLASETPTIPFVGKCAMCGSHKIMHDARVEGHERGRIKVVVFGAPEAMIFTDRLSGELSAEVCGQCGHVQFRVRNQVELYDHVVKARGD